jgi:O-antigen/teichoic acid export membrane protein
VAVATRPYTTRVLRRFPTSTTSRASSRAGLPLVIGLAAQAVTTYLVLVLAGRSLGPVGFAALSSLYFLLTSTATGLFTPLEQEVTARRGGERARGTWDDSLRRRALGHGLGAAALAVGLTLAIWPVTSRALGDQGWLVVSFCLALPGYACWFASRGELAGQGRLGVYGAQLVVDGVVRLVGAAALVLTDHATSAGFGLLFGLSPWLAYAVAPRAGHAPPEGRQRLRTPPLTGALALLVLSALAAQLLINAGPLVVSLLASDSDRDRVGVYLAVLVVVRVPVYLFTAVQPGFLRALAEHAGGGRRTEFGHLLRLVLTAVSGLVVVACLLATLLAPPVVSWLFDFDQQLPRLTCLLLTLAVGLFLVATVMAQALIALGHHLWVATGWLLGLVGLAVGTAFGGEVTMRATEGLLTGAVLATAALGGLLYRELAGWATTGPEAETLR